MYAIAAAVFSICFIQLVTSQCPQNCQTCDKYKNCLSCKPGYWGASFVNCAVTCSGNCANSNCSDNGYCYACVDGKYGPKCEHDCQSCKNGECGLRECTLGCKDGYYQYISGNFSYCNPCREYCQQCQDLFHCTLCNTGYYILKSSHNSEPKNSFATCMTCEYVEKYNICNECSKLSNCLQCSESSGLIACEHCTDGYTLINHQCVENIQCPLNCLNGCTSDGFCNECTDGTTGIKCNYNCYDNCAKCSQKDQNMCNSCKVGFYSTTCAISCPQNCATTRCDFDNGRCLDGCLFGFWGDKCENNCSKICKQFDCHQNGTCTQECREEYGGIYCNITMATTLTAVPTLPTSIGTASSNTRSESSTGVTTINNYQEGSLINGPVIGSAVAGAVVITALLVGSIALFFYRRSISMIRNKE